MLIERTSAPAMRSLIKDFVMLLQDAIAGGASVGFIAPLHTEEAEAYWTKVIREVENNERIVIVALEGNVLAGCVHIVPATTQNGKHRAEIQKMLVHSRFRRRGLGRSLLATAEHSAREMGKTLLILDTERNSPGEALYTAAGWERSGVISGFATDASGKQLIDTVIFFKLLK